MPDEGTTFRFGDPLSIWRALTLVGDYGGFAFNIHVTRVDGRLQATVWLDGVAHELREVGE